MKQQKRNRYIKTKERKQFFVCTETSSRSESYSSKLVSTEAKSEKSKNENKEHVFIKQQHLLHPLQTCIMNQSPQGIEYLQPEVRIADLFQMLCHHNQPSE